ncbi:MAG: TonB-dependent receptor plug domain-containing protein, partial [Pseudomonadota bacterium]
MKNTTKTTFGLKAGLSFSVGLTALIAGSGMTAMAQDEAEDEAKRLNTVTITATKREQTLQDVPVAVSVVDDSVIEKAEIQDLGDLQSLVPSLTVGQLQSSANTNFIIRGFGNGANNAGIEPSVGVFIDGVYRSRSAAQISDLPNLQRVEVLRGPQSTLFGKNASAGVISIVTRGPQFEQSGSVEAGIGNFNAYRLKGDITGPLSDTVAYSLSGNYNKRDGYADDLATGSDVNQRDRWGLRGQLLFEPSENLSFRVIGDYDQIDEICCVAGNLVNGPTGAAIGLLGGQIDAENPFSYEVFNNFDSTNEIENSGISLQADYALPFADLTSITSFRTVDSVTDQDSDFTSADLVERNLSETNIETFTQEIRLTSNNPDAPFDWMVGAFIFDEQVEVSNEFFYGADFRAYSDILAGGPA